jgi:hypothetical protein
MLRMENKVKGGIVTFYENLYDKSVDWRLKVDGIKFATL